MTSWLKSIFVHYPRPAVVDALLEELSLPRLPCAALLVTKSATFTLCSIVSNSTCAAIRKVDMLVPMLLGGY
jgi:hypothetical protein